MIFTDEFSAARDILVSKSPDLLPCLTSGGVSSFQRLGLFVEWREDVSLLDDDTRS